MIVPHYVSDDYKKRREVRWVTEKGDAAVRVPSSAEVEQWVLISNISAAAAGAAAAASH
jgi:hypothetical protein